MQGSLRPRLRAARPPSRYRAAVRCAAVAVALTLGLQLPTQAEPGSEAAGDVSAEPPPDAKGPRPTPDAICRTLAQAASDNDLPVAFFTRLIWQESRLDPEAVSPAGAQGIAQFMPQTAVGRGLANPFEPIQALRESASYLRELRTTFRGSLGLAAAAYNAGPSRVDAWLAGRVGLPDETRAYVFLITGLPADAWAVQPPPQLKDPEASKDMSCVDLAKLMADSPRRRLTASPAWGPWGVQLAGHWSEGRVLATYERLRRRFDAVLGDRLPLVLYARRRGPARYIVRVSESSRANAEALCARLRGAGGACMVLRNPG